MVDVTDQSKDAKEAHHAVKEPGSKSGSITQFYKAGSGKGDLLTQTTYKNGDKVCLPFCSDGLPNMPHVGQRLFIGSVKALTPSQLSRTGGVNH